MLILGTVLVLGFLILAGVFFFISLRFSLADTNGTYLDESYIKYQKYMAFATAALVGVTSMMFIFGHKELSPHYITGLKWASIFFSGVAGLFYRSYQITYAKFRSKEDQKNRMSNFL